MHVGIVSPCSSGPLASLLPESDGTDLGCGVHFLTTLVRALIERGHRVSVITLSPELAERTMLRGSQLLFYVCPMRTQRRMRDLYKLERQGLREGIQVAKPDLLHAHWTYEFALASLETGLPTVITSHDNAFQQLRFSRDLYRLGRLYLQIRVIRQARFVTAVSPYLANSLRWLLKTDIAMIPNAVEVPSERSDDDRDRSREPVRIATVLNGWGKRKNPKAAIKAFQLFRRERPDAEMFMYGDDFEEGGPAAQWAARSGLSGHIHFSGFLPPQELHSQLRKMSILLHPALEEACPMSILEAMALGLPVIGGIHSGGVPWVLDAGRSGFLTDVRRPSEIARTLLTCLERPEDRHWRQQNAYHRVLSLFSPASVAEQYEKIYERALSTR